MSEQDPGPWRSTDPRDPRSLYYSTHLDRLEPIEDRSLRRDWHHTETQARNDPAVPHWTSCGFTEFDLPPWALVAATCAASLAFLYAIGDRLIALTLGAIAAAVGLGGYLLWRTFLRRR